MLLTNIAKRHKTEIHFPDKNNNIITISSNGKIKSEKETTMIRIVDFDTDAERLEEQEIQTNKIEDLFLYENNKFYEYQQSLKIDISTAYPYYFRYITIYETIDGINRNYTYYIEPNTVSTKTMNEFKKLYAAVCYAYAHSFMIPPDAH